MSYIIFKSVCSRQVSVTLALSYDFFSNCLCLRSLIMPICTIIHLLNEFLKVQSCTNKGDTVTCCCITQISAFGDSVTGAQKKFLLF